MCIWILRRLFGKEKGSAAKESQTENRATSTKNAAPTTQRALENLEETERMLLKKQDYLERKIKEEQETARSYATTNKVLALQALDRKKKFESQLARNVGVLKNIASQRNALENAFEDAAVLEAMGQASKALHSAHKMDIDQVTSISQ
ncbi:SNF7 family protein [Oesophagostomum dentatum]|uniref:SNF7 family protein n=1 Tax=Oesophagostomum dentatum TaxID=61180 RepID=A0A0B1SQH6_OESDE|nr:SNF7 family protein [Oesophagostomum dentatum]